jgi:hypothetical protein
MSEPEHIERYRRELERAVAAKDDDALRRAYRELLQNGETRPDVLSEMIRIATGSHQARRARETSDPVESVRGGAVSNVKTNLFERAGDRAFERVRLPTHFAASVIREITQQLSENTHAPVDPQPSAVEDRPAPAPKRATRALFTTTLRAAASVAVFLLLHGSAGIPSASPTPISEPSAVGAVPEEASIVASAPIPGAPPNLEMAPAAPPTEKAETKTPETVQTVNVAHGSSPSPEVVPEPPTMAVAIPAPPIGANGQENSNGETKSPASSIPSPELLVRGDALFAAGDLTSARLFYERAANAGDAQAALRLGETYDPAFLVPKRFGGGKGDAGLAGHWYLRADALGSAEAGLLLKALVH